MAKHERGLGHIALASAMFYLASLGVSALYALMLPGLVLPRRIIWTVMRSYIRVHLWLLRVICGQSYHLEGRENLPSGPAILASRHESMWETLVLPVLLDHPAAILKQEILRYPLAGLIIRRLGHIGVDRGGGMNSARSALEAARRETNAGRRILIFPSGTRDPARRDALLSGVAVLYRGLGLACVPIVHDSGKFWPHRSWLRRPGVISIKIRPAIPSGLRTSEFLERLNGEITKHSDNAVEPSLSG